MMIDLNCDLGEGESAARTRALMRAITSANVACGGHAGDLLSMTRCVHLAAELGVHLGAHPGPAGEFGRTAYPITAPAFAAQLVQQVAALEKITTAAGVALHHIKLHGAWYHAVDADAVLARVYLNTVQQYFPQCAIYALSGGRVARLALRRKMTLFSEVFADRAYRPDGSLVPRNEPGALLDNATEAALRLRHWIKTGQMATINGGWIRLHGQTVCVHSDSPHVLALLHRLQKLRE